MAHVDWYVEGPAYGNCNCGYACPCQFEEDPTQGNCRGFEVMEITKGHFAEVDLSGVKVAIVYAWPGPIYEGGGEMQLIIDKSASPEQRTALETVLTGGETDEEATHWWVFRAMCPTLHDTIYATIEMDTDMEARRAEIQIGDILTSEGRPIKPPHSEGEHRVRIDMPNGIEFSIAEVGNASTTATTPIKLDLKDSYGQWHFMKHGPTGVVH
ncbi:DUF1326 domain-containing protein [Roseovarius aestuariivivens]|uniref:DUF1326 domain-containing protein n=1 Tax=Roseovarius aestuariivivens TaxID=1888910 RepID=UPI00107FDD76|nr:DUF1326 domain-containing protein [Roseovarius aestuariivivens]